MELETEALNAAEHVQEYIMNIDLTDSQYNLQSLFDEAQKLGMDIDDLKEYGFDERAMNCNGSACRKID